jgi:hypothetical protein
MSDITFTWILLSGFLIGWASKALIDKLSEHLKAKKMIEDVTKQFSQVLENIRSNKALFKSRVNQTVYISTDIVDYGPVDIVYLMDKKDVALFKGNKCIYTTHIIDTKVVSDIITSIRIKFNSQINDVVEVMGITISKSDFEKSLGVSLKDIEKQQQAFRKIQEDQKSDIDKIIENNEKMLSMDDILDKIGKVGYNNLTQQEKEFLKKNSN